ncbi:MAG: transketolase [Firmicutes bacterium]|nr:transketolase [Bacillota bacterium]
MAAYHGTREAFAAALMELAHRDERVVFVSPDSLKAMRATAFAETFPDRYVEVGIAEQCAVDVAGGLASCGLTPFVATYAGFLTMRACEQMRTFVAYPNLNVKFVGINGGLIGGEREGVTHQFYEDIGILSSIPNFAIFTPADGNQLYHAMLAAAETQGPVYIRAGSGKEPDIYTLDAPFRLEGVTVWREDGYEALLLSSGFVLDRALEAADILYKQGFRVTTADINIIRHSNPETLLKLLAKAQCVVTVEDHSIYGGLGSWVQGLVCETSPKHVSRIGIQNVFGESGDAKALADAYGLSAQTIVQTVVREIGR